MSVYTNIMQAHYNSLEGKIKPVLCENCRKDGFSNYGECPRCLRNYAAAKEYMQTHTFITDEYLEEYHDTGHSNIKQIPLRLPNERPRMFYGIELEIEMDTPVNGEGYYDDDDEWVEEDSSERNEILRGFTKITNGLFVYERDSSLENGIEFISRPCSYAYWTHPDTVKILKEGMEYLIEHGAWKDQPTRNGMHIHISNSFMDNCDNPAASYENFDWLFQKFQTEIEKLGGRKYTEYCRSKIGRVKRTVENSVYGVGDGIEIKAECKLKKGGNLPCGDHGSAVTLSGPTIEARVFKSTTDYKQILSNIELVRNFAHASRNNDIDHTLNEILHTKDNLYLDEHIQKTRMESAKKKEMLDVNIMNDNEITFTVERS